jgi:hypothetical protein
MSRRERDREDLMAQATALVRRAEFDVPGQPENVIAGYRRDGALSIYFGADPCYHFDAALRLRRAFVNGFLYRTQGHTLARLQRTRTMSAVELFRHDLTDDERDAFCRECLERLQQFHAALQSGRRCVHEIPAGADLPRRVTRSLEQLLSTGVKLAPAIGGKR